MLLIAKAVFTSTTTHLHFHHGSREALLSSRLDTLNSSTNPWDYWVTDNKITIISFFNCFSELKPNHTGKLVVLLSSVSTWS